MRARLIAHARETVNKVRNNLRVFFIRFRFNGERENCSYPIVYKHEDFERQRLRMEIAQNTKYAFLSFAHYKNKKNRILIQKIFDNSKKSSIFAPSNKKKDKYINVNFTYSRLYFIHK